MRVFVALLVATWRRSRGARTTAASFDAVAIDAIVALAVIEAVDTTVGLLAACLSGAWVGTVFTFAADTAFHAVAEIAIAAL